ADDDADRQQSQQHDPGPELTKHVPTSVTALAGQGRMFPRPRLAVDPAEDHPTGIGLQHAGDGDAHLVAYGPTPLLHHHHGAVVEVADTLADLVALLDDADRQALAGQRHQLEGVGQLVEVDDVHPLQLADLVEVEVVGDHARV